MADLKQEPGVRFGRGCPGFGGMRDESGRWGEIGDRVSGERSQNGKTERAESREQTAAEKRTELSAQRFPSEMGKRVELGRQKLEAKQPVFVVGPERKKGGDCAGGEIKGGQ